MKSWDARSSKIVYENPWLAVREDQVTRPDGNPGIYGVVMMKTEGVVIVPVDENGNTYLVLQERYTIGRESWELVAGGTDTEDAEIAARRELLEESGLEAKNVEKVISFYSTVGFSDHRMTVYLATDLTEVTSQLDEVDGILAVRKLPLSEAKDMILRGEIIDGITITALLTTMSYLENKEEK